jgi:hypothetical protein
MNRAFISVLIIFALVSALVSPACAFMNGSMSMIEICAADGSVQTVAIDTDQAPVSPAKHNTEKECNFCFASAHAKPISTGTIQIAPPLSSQYLQTSNGTITPARLLTPAYNAQAPPNFI